MPTFDPTNIPAIVHAIEQVLGVAHPIPCTVQAAEADPDLVLEAWAAIESLPDEQRTRFLHTGNWGSYL